MDEYMSEGRYWNNISEADMQCFQMRVLGNLAGKIHCTQLPPLITRHLAPLVLRH